MKKKTIDEINKHTSPYSCLFILVNGKLIRIRVPFKVRHRNINGKEEKVYTVAAVKCDQLFRLKYIIDGKSYPASDFELLL